MESLQSLEWSVLAPYIFGLMALTIAGWIGKSIGDLGATGKLMQESIAELNTNFAVVGEKVNGHEKRIEKLEECR